MVQCNTTLIIIGGANKGTCRDTIYQYLSTFIRIFGRQKIDNKTYFLLQNNLCLQPFYLQNYLTPYDNVRTNLTRSSTQKSIKTFRAKTKAFESSFFPDCAKECVKLSQ